MSKNKSNICDIDNWVVTHRHCCIDGKAIELAGNAFNITVNDLKKEFTRGYTKILPDGAVIPRLEVTDTERITANDLIQNMTKMVSFKLSNVIQKVNGVKRDQKDNTDFRNYS